MRGPEASASKMAVCVSERRSFLRKSSVPSCDLRLGERVLQIGQAPEIESGLFVSASFLVTTVLNSKVRNSR